MWITWVVSGFMVKMASWRLPRNESMTRAPDTITTPITLKLGDVWASAKVKRISPTTRSTAEIYSCTGYLRRRPGMKAPIIITGSTCISGESSANKRDYMMLKIWILHYVTKCYHMKIYQKKPKNSLLLILQCTLQIPLNLRKIKILRTQWHQQGFDFFFFFFEGLRLFSHKEF